MIIAKMFYVVHGFVNFIRTKIGDELKKFTKFNNFRDAEYIKFMITYHSKASEFEVYIASKRN